MARSSSILAGLALCSAVGAGALAAPVTSPLVLEGSDDMACVGASALGMYTALGDSFQDRIRIIEARGTIVRDITRAQLLALAPWMSLDGGPDGPSALAFTSSGKQVFIAVHDDTLPGDGLGSDVVLRYDLATNQLALHARADLFDRGDQFPHLAMGHFRAVVYVGSVSATGGSGGVIRAYGANAGLTGQGALLATWTPPGATGPGGTGILGMAIDRDSGTMFVATSLGVYRTLLTNNFSVQPSWTQVTTTGIAPGIRGLAWGDAYGLAGTRGLYMLREGAGGASVLDFVPSASALGTTPTTPVSYANAPGGTTFWHAVAARGDGALILGTDEDALVMRDDADTLPGFEAWLGDEFAQVLAFSRGLIAPDGEPSGWVIDADTIPSLPRFHPATPDGAAWVVLMLLTSDALGDDPQAQQQVRTILGRHAGMLPGPQPSRTSDGIFRHWIDPFSGNAKPGWDPEFATLSTMKIVAAASRAMDFYPDDPQIARAASRIIFRTRNWDTYVQAGTNAMFFKAQQAGGPDLASASRPFHEGITFMQQASAYGGLLADTSYIFWINRANHPTATYIAGLPISVAVGNIHQPAFISVYPALLQDDFRADQAWRAQIANIRWNHAAWTDDFGTRFSTVFSAGTTRSDWGGYHADTLGDRPGNVTTFPALMGLSALGDPNPAAGAYHAFRRGARQTFRSGASILYRRSDIDRTYLPNSAGLPDVAMGALGLAELMQPGVVDAVLANPPAPQERCPTDLTGDGLVGVDDLYAWHAATSDLNGDGQATPADGACQANWLRRHERRQLLSR